MSNASDIVLRTTQVNVKLSEEESERLGDLAKHLALTPQGVLRLLIKRATDEFRREGRWPVDAIAAHAAPPVPKTSGRRRGIKE